MRVRYARAHTHILYRYLQFLRNFSKTSRK